MIEATRKPYRGAHVNSAYHAPILQSWRMKFNTHQIAEAFDVKECDVARIIARDQDRRHREWNDAAPVAKSHASA